MNNVLPNEDWSLNGPRAGAFLLAIFTFLLIANAYIFTYFAHFVNLQGNTYTTQPVPITAVYWIIGATIALLTVTILMISRERGGLLVLSLLIHIIAWAIMITLVIIICQGIITEAHITEQISNHQGFESIEFFMFCYPIIVYPPYWIAVIVHFIIKIVVVNKQERRARRLAEYEARWADTGK